MGQAGSVSKLKGAGGGKDEVQEEEGGTQHGLRKNP